MTSPRFSAFVILGAMRTGSNLLEKSLAAVPGVTTFGEAFNPSFVGFPNKDEVLGIGRAARDADPVALFDRIRAVPGLTGFRYFPDHDARVLAPILDDPATAKIVLGRNPVESYVSLKIARTTGQWMLTNAARRRDARVAFDCDEFAAYLADLRAFQREIREGLQDRGQTAFWLDYADLSRPAALAGLARHLGLSDRVTPSEAILRQNPGPVTERLTNPEALGDLLSAEPLFAPWPEPGTEPARGPAVPSFRLARTVPLAFLPVPGGPTAAASDWLAAVGDGIDHGLSQGEVRQWMRRHPGHRRFAVIRHPLPRAYDAFADIFLRDERTDLRDRITRLGRIDPALIADRDGGEARRALFRGFLAFLEGVLAGQSAVRLAPGWASQSAALQGFAEFAPPDLLIREEDMAEELPLLAQRFGTRAPAPVLPAFNGLGDILDEDIEAQVRKLYPRDVLLFGAGRWKG